MIPSSRRAEESEARAADRLRSLFADQPGPVAPASLRAFASKVTVRESSSDRGIIGALSAWLARRMPAVGGIFAIGVVVAVAGLALGVRHPTPVTPGASSAPAVHYSQQGLAFDYPASWRLAPQYVTSGTMSRAVATFLIGDASIACNSSTGCAPALGASSAAVEVGWYKAIEPFGPWPPSDAIETLTIGGQPAALVPASESNAPMTILMWRVEMVHGQESFYLELLSQGLDVTTLRGEVEQLLRTVEPPTTR